MAFSNNQNTSKSDHLVSSNLNAPARPLSPTALYTIKALAYCRIILGAGSLLFPHFTCGLFKFLISNETSTVICLFGVRGIALGELLLTAKDETSPDGGRKELRRLLKANMGCDVCDIFSIGFAVASGYIGLLPGALLAGGAASLVGVAALGLESL
ncbi:hypothetical protein DM02DRAFT_627536 [Periconia macrospinosa]|uniref:Uncharacterized protein n=1 Tax=Periconia macrospinosa TaxID=97972 RepID=A0A2V1DTL0_9PLEO|nr:hypothetical protein DM02DRAFT_627536 [Periconia macrospinosa]